MDTTTAQRTPTAASGRLLDIDGSRNYIGGISRESFYKLVRSGDLAVVKIGRRTFVDRSELDRFVDSLGGAA